MIQETMSRQERFDAACDDLIQNALDVVSMTKIPLVFIVLERGSRFYAYICGSKVKRSGNPR